ncbi:MAG: type IA DNA topoisomerase [Clostridia bacterium]|nr:type IA DNA topoisomerase [Clostridia bacterium]
MSKKLLITEKPSVAMEFAKALKVNTTRKNGYLESDEYLITWCVGHLVTMSYPEVYDEKYKMWRFDTLPFIPTEWKYEIIDSVRNQFEIVKSLLTNEEVDTIYVCTDSGREGEYIYRLVDQMVDVQGKNKKRVWIDSQTEEEILNGIKNAKDLSEYDALADSAYLRAKEDYLIGINFSRLLTLSYGKEVAKRNNEEKTSISVGRVMTCVLGMIVERECEIKNFVKSKFYKVQVNFEEGISAEWKCEKENAENLDIVKMAIDKDLIYNDVGFKNEADALSFIEALKKSEKEPVVLESSKKNQKENAPLLYNLAEIQNECSKKFKISPDQTLEVIQLLYEKKLVTYPRTDARVLSSAVAKEIGKNLNGLVRGYKDEEVQCLLKKMIDNKYSTDIAKSKYVDDSKITDHYAIVPTGQGFENHDSLSDMQKDIYKLIVKRFLSIFFPPAEFMKLAVTIDIAGQKFYSNARICVNQGYLEVAKPEKEDNVDESKIEALKKMKKGQKLLVSEYNVKEGETSPPSRYTSGSIILAMENAGKLIEDERLREQIKGSGIGTSATRAEIIKKLTRINYIEINNKTQVLTPSQKGELVYQVVRFTLPDMLNPQLTASWEKGLDMVAKKEIGKEEFLEKLEKYIITKVNKVKKY